MLRNSLNRNIFLCFYVFGHSLGSSEKTFCLEDLGILHCARINICIFEPFPAYSKVGVDQKIFSRHELLLKDQYCVLYII